MSVCVCESSFGGPFFPNGDCVNVDALLTSTERFTFHVFRTSFMQAFEA